jgi:hypothetical protein
MAQTQCPNCGGYRVSPLKTELVYSDYYTPFTPKKLRIVISGLVGVTFLLLVGFVLYRLPLPVAIAIIIFLWIMQLRDIKRGSKEIVELIASFECVNAICAAISGRKSSSRLSAVDDTILSAGVAVSIKMTGTLQSNCFTAFSATSQLSGVGAWSCACPPG